MAGVPMFMVVRGDQIHKWIYHGDIQPNDRPSHVQCQGKTLHRSRGYYSLARGRYKISKEWMLQYTGHHFVLDGFPVSAAAVSVLGWAGNGWDEHEIAVFYKGRQVVNDCSSDLTQNEYNGLYTLEIQEHRILTGEITDSWCIYKHHRLKNKYTDMAILRGVRQMVRNHALGRFLKCPIRWASWRADVGGVQPVNDGCYRLDLRHAMLDNDEPGRTIAGQMFAGVRIDKGRLVVDHCRDRSGIIDYKLLDSLWPTFELADPNCFNDLLCYLHDCFEAGSDVGLKRYARRRSRTRTA